MLSINCNFAIVIKIVYELVFDFFFFFLILHCFARQLFLTINLKTKFLFFFHEKVGFPFLYGRGFTTDHDCRTSFRIWAGSRWGRGPSSWGPSLSGRHRERRGSRRSRWTPPLCPNLRDAEISKWIILIQFDIKNKFHYNYNANLKA